MIHKLISGIADRDTRNQSAEALAKHLHCSHLLIFIKDSELDILLPAPEFPQTMHLDKKWMLFFKETQKLGVSHGHLSFPDKQNIVNAIGVASGLDAVAVLLNGRPEEKDLYVFIDLFPMLARVLIQEQKVLSAETKTFFAEKAALKAEHLTKTIDGMRQILNEALVKQQQDKKEIEELLRKKDDFMNIASHELKTPMTSLKAYMQLLQRGSSATTPQVIATNSLKQMNRLEGLINDLLHVSKLRNGKLAYEMELVDFSEIVMETVNSLQITSPKHQLIIKHNPTAYIYSDKERLEQVLTNYITNAVKYSPNAHEVIINSEVQDEYLIVSVQDFGIGIAKEHLSSLFERFYRVDNTAMKYEGLGLGLYIASEIISRHGGNFWIESEINKGSVFYFKLPLNQVAVSPDISTNNNEYITDFVEIKVDEQAKILEVNWKGYNNLQTVKDGCMKMIEYLKSHKLDKILNSNKNVLGSWAEATEWVGKEWFPLIELAGLKHFAWVYSQVTFSQLSAEKTNELKIGKVVTRFFDLDEQARDWLVSL